MARQDSSATASTPLSDRFVGQAPARARQPKIHARQPDLSRLLRRTLAALERDVPALRAAEVSPTEVAAFLAEQLGVLPAPSAPASAVQGVSGTPGPRAAEASSSAAAQAAVLDALRQLEQESPRGALLSVRELRARSVLDKPSFDRAALELAGQGKVSLHAHDHAGALPESERRALIEDVRGAHYVGIAAMPDNHDEVNP